MPLPNDELLQQAHLQQQPLLQVQQQQQQPLLQVQQQLKPKRGETKFRTKFFCLLFFQEK